MKKAVSVLVFCALLACTILPLAVSADGMIMWTDDFSAVQENDWIWEGDLFEVNNGKLEGWAEAVVHQSNFLARLNGTKRFKDCCFKVTCFGLEDGGHDSETHSLGLWWADYMNPSGDENIDNDGQLVYTLFYEFETHKLSLNVGFDGDAEAFRPADYPEEGDYLSVIIPDGVDMDDSGNTSFTLGMRIRNGVICGYYNDTKYFEINGFRGAATASQLGSPIILWNSGCHCYFDDFIAATADYNLFNESEVPEPVVTEPDDTTTSEETTLPDESSADPDLPTTPVDPDDTTTATTANNDSSAVRDDNQDNGEATSAGDNTNNGGQNEGGNTNNGGQNQGSGNNASDGSEKPQETKVESVVETKVETKTVVAGTDEEGNVVTEIVTEVVSEVVTRVVADTNNVTPSANQGGSQTGDTAAIVIAVMIVALGAAIVVKKVGDR